MAAAQTARTNALRDAYSQYEAALETAAQEGNDAVKAIVATYHEGKRQAEITRRETIENESKQHEGQVKAARIKMQEDLIRLSEQFDKNYELVRFVEDNHSDLESFSYFFDLEYTEVGDKVPESVKSASLFHFPVIHAEEEGVLRPRFHRTSMVGY